MTAAIGRYFVNVEVAVAAVVDVAGLAAVAGCPENAWYALAAVVPNCPSEEKKELKELPLPLASLLVFTGVESGKAELLAAVAFVVVPRRLSRPNGSGTKSSSIKS